MRAQMHHLCYYILVYCALCLQWPIPQYSFHACIALSIFPQLLSHLGSGRITPTRNSRFLAVKHRTNSLENSGGSSSNRPRSATAHYQQARRLSSTNKETAASKPELSMDSRRDSTPVSGQGTPVSKGVGRDSVDGGVVSTAGKSTALPPRTPYR